MITEHAPYRFIYFFQIEFRRLVIQFPESSAFALCFSCCDRLHMTTFGTDIIHVVLLFHVPGCQTYRALFRPVSYQKHYIFFHDRLQVVCVKTSLQLPKHRIVDRYLSRIYTYLIEKFTKKKQENKAYGKCCNRP